MSTDVFERQAAGYDDVAESALGRALRSRVHRVVEPLLRPDASVVDLGCGTGIDAAWLAPQVGSVLAVDRSAAMVARAAQRCGSLPNVTVLHHDMDRAGFPGPALLDRGAHDLVVADFGVVNCLADWERLGPGLHGMLVAGGHAVLVTMPRWCPAELAVGLATLDRSALARRYRGSADYGGTAVRYASARRLARCVAPELELVAQESLGLVLPPFEQRDLVENRPRLLAALAALDRRLARAGGILGVGDHQIAVFRRRS